MEQVLFPNYCKISPPTILVMPLSQLRPNNLSVSPFCTVSVSVFLNELLCFLFDSLN